MNKYLLLGFSLAGFILQGMDNKKVVDVSNVEQETTELCQQDIGSFTTNYTCLCGRSYVTDEGMNNHIKLYHMTKSSRDNVYECPMQKCTCNNITLHHFTQTVEEHKQNFETSSHKRQKTLQNKSTYSGNVSSFNTQQSFQSPQAHESYVSTTIPHTIDLTAHQFNNVLTHTYNSPVYNVIHYGPQVEYYYYPHGNMYVGNLPVATLPMPIGQHVTLTTESNYFKCPCGSQESLQIPLEDHIKKSHSKIVLAPDTGSVYIYTCPLPNCGWSEYNPASLILHLCGHTQLPINTVNISRLIVTQSSKGERNQKKS